MNAIAKIEPRKSVIATLADSYGMEAQAFEATLRGTVFPASGTREEFAAFVLVAKEYRLNPLLREIYAFPKKGGGIVPIVGIDGWLNLINGHQQFDGMEFDQHDDEKGALIAVTCRIFRKDRSHPTVVTEYLEECIRGTEPWKMKRRMLRHKAAMQCARYAFGFSGIYDEDEAADIAQVREVGGGSLPTAPPPPPSDDELNSALNVEDAVVVSDSADIAPKDAADAAGASTTAPQSDDAPVAPSDDAIDPEAELSNLDEKLGFATNSDDVEAWYVETDVEAVLADFSGFVERAREIRDRHVQRTSRQTDASPAAPSADEASDDVPPPPAGDDDAGQPEDMSTPEAYEALVKAKLTAASDFKGYEEVRSWWSATRPVRHALGIKEHADIERLQNHFAARKGELEKAKG
ncbi:RecT family recombinase [Bosea sp. UNC402CLCol]|uniref:RecT family recombinase n=1 Tax=Bosea sp. UNC402CLCol TaxID=1510531 RepID=UPI00068FD4D9|nr:RecT family recombinase [Bosea sp. UNC402CLCol]